jgi:hypothetical protein
LIIDSSREHGPRAVAGRTPELERALVGMFPHHDHPSAPLRAKRHRSHPPSAGEREPTPSGCDEMNDSPLGGSIPLMFDI